MAVDPLPSGTLTLLFSDIEGSTLMLNRLGARWGEALSAQRKVLRSAFAAHDGWEMGTEGDSFFVVFASAQQAIRAAVEGQQTLRRQSWPDGVDLRVRIGVHTGEPKRHEDGYVGLDVHRAARIASTASGGQIVISAATFALLSDTGLDITVRDLGWHRLKDMPDSEHLFDVVAPGMLTDFPPLRSLGTRANLPAYGTDLVGRGDDLHRLRELMRERGARLVTLTGPGGSGKTRLAVALVEALYDDYPCDTFFVPLHTADRPALMWAGIAEALGAGADSAQKPHERALRHLRDRSASLVLDNLEQVAEADRVVSQLLNDAPHVRVVATSRRPLHLVDEREYPVAPLAVPDRDRVDPAEVRSCSAIDLFVRRARMARPTFALTADNVQDVIRLCRRLDGLPLALELAAARLRLLSPRAVLRRLDQDLGAQLLGSTERAERQRTLTAMIAWSYDLLEEEDRRTFRRLGVFAGRVDLTAIAEVAASDGSDPLDTVAHLVDVSLAQVVEAADGEPLISLLETIRQFARHRLQESGECDEIRMRHARWCLQVATEVRDQLLGSHRVAALDRLSSVEEDIRAALDWCLQPAAVTSFERRDCGYALLEAMNTYWYRFGYVAEGRGWADRGLAIAESADGADSARFLDALHGAGILAIQQNDLSAGTTTLERALEMARRMGDVRREARECNSLGVARREAGELDAARQLIERSIELAREFGDPRLEATALTNVVLLYTDAGKHEAAVEAARGAIEADKALGDPWGIAISETNLVLPLLYAQGPAAAYRQLAATAERTVAVGDTELSINVLEAFAVTLAASGDHRRAATLLGVSDGQRAAAGMPRTAPDEELIAPFISEARAAIDAHAWQAAYAAGLSMSLQEGLALSLATPARA